jgi:hypothetical protein
MFLTPLLDSPGYVTGLNATQFKTATAVSLLGKLSRS